MAEVRADTWMPLYVADYLKDTTHLSTIEHGAYFLLLLHAWTHDGLLPSDEKRIARIAGLSPKDWKASGDVLLKFFTASEDGFRHSRVERELVRAGNIIEQRRAAGKASAAARAAQRNLNGRSTSVATNGQRNSRPSQSPSQEGRTPDKESGVATQRANRLPQGFEVPDDWLEWAVADRGWSHSDAGAEAASFVDYWHAKSGRDATKLDWQATWRNWVRNSRREGNRKAQTYDPDRITV